MNKQDTLPELSGACQVRAYRGNCLECVHLFYAAVVSPTGALLYSTPGAADLATFFRSSGKPFQALPFVTQGLHRKFPLQVLALACASHTASAEHLHWVTWMLDQLGPDAVRLLQCGPHAPIDEAAQASLIRHSQPSTPIHNNCSGKHAAMLLYVRAMGLDPAHYLDPDHPLQQAILAGIREYSGVTDIPIAIDGCGAPTYDLPLPAMARLFANLATQPAFQPIIEAMTTYPELIGGPARVDSVLMGVTNSVQPDSVRQSHDNNLSSPELPVKLTHADPNDLRPNTTPSGLVAKVGADGLICVGNLQTGQGLALKLLDGNGPVRDIAVVHLLRQLGWLDDTAWASPLLTPWANPVRTNTQGKPVGHYAVDRCQSVVSV